MKVRKKLIEVALPLDAINKASAREKSIRHGHPSTLHLWWARRPLAAARAVIFAQIVDDPSEYVDVLRQDPRLKRKAETELKAKRKAWEEAKALHAKAQGTGFEVPEPGLEPTLHDVLAEQERQRLFRIIEDLVQWENTTNDTVLQAAREEIWASWRRACLDNVEHPRSKELFDRKKLPAFHDPFAGGGALPLEAQRLGLHSYASDLNPVAVLINKAMIEIPPRFSGMPPVNPASRKGLAGTGSWKGAQGMAEDVRYYGNWMRDEAEKRVGYLYPQIEITREMAKVRADLNPLVGQKLTVIAWLWARTVKSPNPAFANVDVPLASTFILSTKAGNEAYVEPVVKSGSYRFAVKTGKPRDPKVKDGTKLAGANFVCLMSGTPISGSYIKAEGMAGRMGATLLAVVASTERGRIYLSPTKDMEAAAHNAKPAWKPDVEFLQQALGFRVGNYGMTKWSDLFTARQIVSLATYSDLVQEARKRVAAHAVEAGLPAGAVEKGGTSAQSYADAVATYLALGVSKLADYNAALVQWSVSRDQAVHVFGRQVVPMVWDYAEVNIFAGAAGDLMVSLTGIAKVLDSFLGDTAGVSTQADASIQTISAAKVVSTDPPYYDNIGYADLSDFFYVWLRRCLRDTYPDLFGTMVVPKAEELVATPARHGGTEGAELFFLTGMTQAMHRVAEQVHPAFPVTIYYAFKQAENDREGGTASTGWETFLDAVIKAGFATSGTWPMRTEKPGRMRENDSNALASSIILVCRARAMDSPTATRREFVSALRDELPRALGHLQRGSIAPVDLAQAAIGPGMAIYTRYAKVLDADGKPLAVRDALALINQTLDEALAEQEGDFDADSRWALTWFDQVSFEEGEYGIAEQLSKSKNTSVAGMVQAGIIESKRGKVRLLRSDELAPSWDPTADSRLTAWEIVHHLIRVLGTSGEGAAAELVKRLGVKAEIARELAYRLYTLCERKKRATEAMAYNGLVQSWPEITRLAREGGAPRPEQAGLFGENEE